MEPSMGRARKVAGVLCLLGMVGGLVAIPFVSIETAVALVGISGLLYFVFRAVLKQS